jgi:hypothetical protein
VSCGFNIIDPIGDRRFRAFFRFVPQLGRHNQILSAAAAFVRVVKTGLELNILARLSKIAWLHQGSRFSGRFKRWRVALTARRRPF